VNTKYEDGFTPLTPAATNGHVEFVRAEADITDQFGEINGILRRKNGDDAACLKSSVWIFVE
jgi:hypothetical protein